MADAPRYIKIDPADNSKKKIKGFFQSKMKK